MFFVFSILFLPFLMKAQDFYEGQIKLTSGEIMKGLIQPPSNSSDSKILYRSSEDSEKEKLSSLEISEMTIIIESNTHHFVRKKVRMPKNKDPQTTKDYRYSKEDVWLVELEKGHTTLYAAGPLIKIKKDGKLQLVVNWNGRGIPPDIMFYIENDKQEMPTWTALYSVATMGQMKIFKFWTSKYFADYPQLVQRIENEEFKVSEIDEVVREYNKFKAGK